MGLTLVGVSLQNIPLKKVHVGDIDIAYKMLGKGVPILLVNGLGGDMNGWSPSTLRSLSSNHRVIIFDNRGIGNTTSGIKPFSIQQFASDTAGLVDALKIQKADVLGYSLGSYVAQQLTVTHPEKVNRLILVAASCGGKEDIPQSPQLLKIATDLMNKSINNIPADPQEVKTLLSLSFGSGWMKLHPNFLETISIPKLKDLGFSSTTMQQLKSAQSWSGICDQLPKLSKPTLVITGTDDVTVLSANSLIIAGKIPGAWLVQIKDAGHALPEQYPDKFDRVLQTFLSTTTNPG
jgi:pimeloyl-ACP methyl ester carboxylesterase